MEKARAPKIRHSGGKMGLEAMDNADNEYGEGQAPEGNRYLEVILILIEISMLIL